MVISRGTSTPSSGTNTPSPSGTSQALPPRDEARVLDVIGRLYEGKEVFFHYHWTAGDLMTTRVRALTFDDTLADCLRLVREQHLRHVPIVEIMRESNATPLKQSVVGIVSDRDLLRKMTRGVGTLDQTDSDRKALAQPIATLATRNPQTVSPETPILDAMELLVDGKFSCLPVVVGPDKDLAGILTSTDLLRCFLMMERLRRARQGNLKPARLVDLAQGRHTEKTAGDLADLLITTAADVMHVGVISVSLDATIERAIQLMKENNIRHLPVVDSQRQPRGILSDRDILRFLPPLRIDASQGMVSRRCTGLRNSRAWRVFRSRFILYRTGHGDPALSGSTITFGSIKFKYCGTH